MYERFTDRARKAMQLANQQAQRFNHEYIGTEHVLLGLLKIEGGSLANDMLMFLKIATQDVLDSVDSKLTLGPSSMVTMGKLPQTPRARKAIEHGMAQAREHGYNYVGTEHILLGLAMEVEGIASEVLKSFGATADKLREAMFVVAPVKERVEPSFFNLALFMLSAAKQKPTGNPLDIVSTCVCWQLEE